LYHYTVPSGLSVAVIFPRTLSVSVLRVLVTSGQRWPTLTVVGGVGVCVVGTVNPLLGCSVLIVEDEPLIALELHEALHGAGASILTAATIKEALALIARAQICAAIVDVNLGGHDCSSVCAALSKRSIPFMFYTGYSSAAALSAWPHAPAVDKPAADRTLVDSIARLLPTQFSLR